jgi:CelD/BcsL family acetyltransferase involved in cellulose biosynthesis
LQYGFAADTTNITVTRGSAVSELLGDPSFIRSWEGLHRQCAWATTFQAPSFVTTWYEVYLAQYEPILILSRNSDGTLQGLFALARRYSDGNLVHAGAHQAEYHTWLSADDPQDRFIESALNAIAAWYTGPPLDLLYLPSAAPLGWTERGRSWSDRIRISRRERPLMTVGPGSTTEQSLRKKSNKSRMNRLARSGPLALVVLRSRDELEPFIDRIADYCDLRHGAVHGSLPFRRDPLKKEFHLRMADIPGLLHMSVLCAGDELLGAHLGARDRSSVQFGVSAHSPVSAENSPGKILILLLARQLGAEGYSDLDLTPGGDAYKSRFADHTDSVYFVRIFFRHKDLISDQKSRRRAELAKALLVRAGMQPEDVRRRLRPAIARVRQNTVPTLLWKSLRWMGRTVTSDVRLNYYRMSVDQAARNSADPRFRRDCISDLLLYEQASASDRSPRQFLQDALHRLESGGHVFTVCDGKRLMHYAWLSPTAGPTGTEVGNTIEIPPKSLMLWDDFTHPACRGAGLHQASIRHRLAEAAITPDVDHIFISVLSENRPSRHNIERAGFQLYGTVVRRIRFGKRTWEWNLVR